MPITYGTLSSLQTMILENEWVRVVILLSRGADILEFIHKKSGHNMLYRSDLPISAYDGLDLSRQRLAYHSDRLLGGYMDLLPHRGCYQGRVLEQNEGGIAATLPWHVVEAAEGEAGIRVTCEVTLPVFPLFVRRTYILGTGSRSLRIEEAVRNTGPEEMLFTWTQHILLGGGILEGDARITVPGEEVFKAWEQMHFPDDELSRFRADKHRAELSQGIFDLTKVPGENCRDFEFVVFDRLEEGSAGIVNRKLGLGIALNWELECLPYLRFVMRNKDGRPLVGLEPSDDLFSGWEHSARHHTYTRLAAGETLETWFTLGFIEHII